MASPSVPKLNLSPVRLNRLDSVDENTTRNVVQTERVGRDGNPRTKKKKKKIKRLSRRDSMMELLREDLKNLDPLPVLKTYRPPSENDILKDENDKVDGDESPFQLMAQSVRSDLSKRRKSSISGIYFRDRKLSSTSNENADDTVVTGYELKKIRMIQTLENMGYELPKVRNRTHSSNEKEILETIGDKEKKGLIRRHSLSTRLLQYVPERRKRDRSRSKDRSMQGTPSSRPETPEETREKLQKMLNLISKPAGNTDNSLSPRRTNNDEGQPIPGNFLKESLGTFRRKIRRKKVRPFIRWKRFSKFLVILLRAWKIHSQSVASILGLFDTLEAITDSASKQDLMFDMGNFKAAKEASISSEAKRILKKTPGTRSEEELHYVRVALRNYKSIVEYPVGMQHKIAARSWFESYDARRVIVREGHIPVCFYFVLTGSAVVSYLDVTTNAQKTVLFLHRGDSFGEQAIMTQSLRQTTVLSREKIELLVMHDEDFIDIFMSGGLRDVNDPFIQSLSFLKGWPVEKLAENPKKAIFSFFKRNTVLVKDSTKSEWIFIVKSGSCSVFKKLRFVDPTRKIVQPAKKEWRKHIEDSLKVGASLSHEDQLTLLCEEEIKKLEQQNLSMRFYALPEINIATNEAYNDLRKQRQDIVQASQVKKAMEDLKNRAAEAGSVVSEPEDEEEKQLQEQAKGYRRMSIVDLSNLVAKGPYMTKTRREDSTVSAVSGKESVTTYPTIEETVETADDYATGYDVTQERASSNGPPSSKPGQHPDFRDRDDHSSMYVIVNTLTKGQAFGLEDVVFDNQPGFSLVSNGAEVIMLNKKFYTENLTTHQFIVLRESVWPYPSDEQLQKNLETYIRWDYHKKLNLKKVIRKNKQWRMNVNDARSSLYIPPEPDEKEY